MIFEPESPEGDRAYSPTTDEIEILKRISVVNRDNGIRFTEMTRLNVIAKMLEGTAYHLLNEEGLFHMYGKLPLESYENALLLSTHVDCESNITRCFTKVQDDGTLVGTFDNMLTNAAALTLMLRDELPDNVIVVFTGDEEENSVGAIQAGRFLEDNDIDFMAIVLDVTDAGYGVADFTIEKTFWNKEIGKLVISVAKSLGDRWRFVPEEDEPIPKYVPRSKVVAGDEEASDESDTYDDLDIKCFSLCTPTSGDMHCDVGINTRVDVFRAYIHAVNCMVKACSTLELEDSDDDD